MTRIGVVIPHFQREPGLLARAVSSVLAQCGEVALVIVVVDDASPLPATVDLATINVPSPHELILVRQDNGGPGVARNAGLDRLATEAVGFVAFLDSDDWWTDSHLAEGLATLGDGADLFFADHDREQYAGEASYFTAHGRLKRWIADGVAQPCADQRFSVAKGAALRFFLEDYPAQTSTVLFRRIAAIAPLRFDPQFRSLGEDLLFFLDVVREARQVVFSTRMGAHCGAGVSIYHSALSWDHPEAPMRFAYSLLLWSTVAQRFALTTGERVLVEARIAGFRRGFTYIWTRHAVRRKQPHQASVLMLRKQLGWRWRQMLLAALGLVSRRLRGQPMFPEH